MQKTDTSRLKDALSANGKIWVKTPSMNYRQSSGVEFRGKYMTLKEYNDYLAHTSAVKMYRENKNVTH